ncbi:flagellar basal body L-ring protein FlgH [Methylobacterium sp. J-070]|uniref:flagellar basal body L-ring protein FlgH n=1 Tax=Methylobacterium sp. J-070 TaxID=2836650 RepID=UPI001FBBE6E3|nr:flagellar basal body L-ring protein FlgH [Methylobacterium sp. J-070]MCJ2048312.1 flagellar basal body L-ring protein FlgH [Methylobacterium sp. J-070]
MKRLERSPPTRQPAQRRGARRVEGPDPLAVAARAGAAVAALAVLTALGACATPIQEIGKAPALSPVGLGIDPNHDSVPQLYVGSARPGYHSTWAQQSADLFQDPRAKNVGDVLTVMVAMNDKAQFDNATDRSRDSREKSSLDVQLDLFGLSPESKNHYEVNGNSSTKGQGTIDRKEQLRLSVAAVVTHVFPNGNILISGSQEVRVNYEVRVLNIAGIVRPRDISRRNTIDYDKIAEARVSYGGRGRLMEVQQPAVVQQVYDLVTPF